MEPTTLADKIKKAMKQKGMNALRLAVDSGLGRSYIYDVLSGRSISPRLENLLKIANSLDVSVNYLLEGSIHLEEVKKVPALNSDNSEEQVLEIYSKHSGFSQYLVQDDAMSPSILPGDRVVVKANCEVEADAVYVVKCDKKFALRKVVELSDGKKIFVSENEKFIGDVPSIIPLNVAEVQGKVFSVIKFC